MYSAENLMSLILEETGSSKIFTYPGSPPKYLYREASRMDVEVSQVVREQHMLHLAQTRYYRRMEQGEEGIPVVIVSGEMGEAMMSQPLLAGSISCPCLVVVAEGRFEHVDNALNIAHQSDRGITSENLSSEGNLHSHDNLAGREMVVNENDLEDVEMLIEELREKKEIGIVHVPLYALEEFDSSKMEGEDFQTETSRCSEDELAERFAKSDKPMIVVGRGAKDPERRERIAKIVNESGAALAATLQMEGYFEENYVGRIGTMGTPRANDAFMKADLVVALGTSVNNLITSYDSENIEEFRDKTIQVEENPRRRSVFVQSWYDQDLDSALEALKGPFDDKWVSEESYGNEDLMDLVPENVRKLGELMRDNWNGKTVNLGVGNHMIWMAYSLGPEIKKEVSRTGSMGEAVSGINREENPVIVLGDGEFEMDLSIVLESYYQDRSPNIFVINNKRLGMVNEKQEAEFGEIFTEKVDRPVKYGELETVFPDMNSYSVETADRLEEVFGEVKEAEDSVNIVEIMVSEKFNPKLYSTGNLPT